MSYWDLSGDEQNKLELRGIDYDLIACLENNAQGTFDIYDIQKVLAVWEGERDADDWRWVIRVTPECAKKNGGRYIFLQGGCDYTGWDCRSSADSIFTTSASKAAHLANPGTRDWKDNGALVYENLAEQLKKAKTETWREKKDKELNARDLPFM